MIVAPLRERWAAIAAQPWRPVTSVGALSAIAVGVVLLAGASLGDRWIPVVDHANLVFHEAGHVIVGLFSSRVAVYGGTLGQLVFPVIATFTFWRRREPVACAIAAFWLCQNLLNIATYLGDARAMQLPLIGGMDPELAHDWREILGRWGLIAWDTRLASLLVFAAWCAGLAIATWLLLRWQAGERGGATRRI